VKAIQKELKMFIIYFLAWIISAIVSFTSVYLVDEALGEDTLVNIIWALGIWFGIQTTLMFSIAKEVKALLDIPDNWIIITFTPLGYPVDDPERAYILPAKRRPLERLVCYEKFEG